MTDKPKRKSISKKIRFEVFKRDSFTCQYCGKSAPEVILEVDHINPASKGGNNDLFNLITSCFDCNRGKTAKLISDDSVIKKQKKQLDILNKKSEQLKMLLDWKEGLININDHVIKRIGNIWSEKTPGYHINDSGINKIRILYKKFNIEEIVDAMNIAERYFRYTNGVLTKDSVEEAFNKIGGICAISKMHPIDKKISYIKGICKNRFNYFDRIRSAVLLKEYVDSLKNHGYSEDDIIEDLESDYIPMVIKCKSWTDWFISTQNWISEINTWENVEKIH